MGVTPNYPKFGAEWGVVATKPKFVVHFFDSRENYARYRQNCNETLLGSQVRPFKKCQHDPRVV